MWRRARLTADHMLTPSWSCRRWSRSECADLRLLGGFVFSYHAPPCGAPDFPRSSVLWAVDRSSVLSLPRATGDAACFCPSCGPAGLRPAFERGRGCAGALARASRRCFASRPLLWATPLGITVQRKPDQRGQLMVHSWAEAVNFTPSGARKTSLRLPSNTPESSTRSSAVIDFLSTGPRLRFGPASHAIKGMSLQQTFHHLCY